MEILSGPGGGLVVVFQYLLQVALVDGVARLAGGGSLAFFFLRVLGRVSAAVKTGENLLNLTKSKRSRIGFKAGRIAGEWCCTGLFGPIF